MYFKRIKELRELYEYTQAFVSRQLGIHPRTYCHYESGDREIPTQVLIKICKLYDVTCNYLLELSDSYYD